MKRHCDHIDSKEDTEEETKHFKEDKVSVSAELDPNLHYELTQQNINQRDDNQERTGSYSLLFNCSKEDEIMNANADDEVCMINSSGPLHVSKSNIKTEGSEESFGSLLQSVYEASYVHSSFKKCNADDSKISSTCNESQISESENESKCSQGVSSSKICDENLHGSNMSCINTKANGNIEFEFTDRISPKAISGNNGQNDQNSEISNENEKVFCESVNPASFQSILPILPDMAASFEKISSSLIGTAIGETKGSSTSEDEKFQNRLSESSDASTSISDNQKVQEKGKKEENLKPGNVSYKEKLVPSSLGCSEEVENLLPRQDNGLELLKHVQKMCLPEKWTKWTENIREEVKFIDIPTHHQKYKKLQEKIEFQLKVSLQSLVRVENPVLWGSYLLRKAEYIARYGEVREQKLYHITSRENADCIAKDNLNWRLCTRCKFGLGVSFSNSLEYAHKYSARRNGSQRAVLVCRVLSCKSILTTDQCGMRYPSEEYDTVYARSNRVCVKFYDYEFYPEYIAKYTKY